MSSPTATGTQLRCLNCGFAADANSDEWESAEHPPLGTLTQCPECSSTDTTRLR